VRAEGYRRRREPPVPPCPPFLIEALVPSPDGSSVAVRVGGRILGRVDPAVPTAMGCAWVASSAPNSGRPCRRRSAAEAPSTAVSDYW